MASLAPDLPITRSLGCGSPRCLGLLAQRGVSPAAVRAPDIAEDAGEGELPRDYVNRIAAEKAAAVEITPDEVVLCADTTVALGRGIMGKPADATEAATFLYTLSGRRHNVITPVAVTRGGRVWQNDVQNTVAIKEVSDEEVNAHLVSDG